MPRGRIKTKSNAPYRIKDLTEITGISKEAVRFYITQGLLPPAVKTAHNMGWYSDRHVELLRFIQKLQTEQFLPLKAIRALLNGDQNLDFTDAQGRAFEDMRRKIAAENRDLTVSDDPARLAQELGLSRWEQKELRALGIAAGGTVSISDVEITRQWIAIRDAGLSLERGFSPANLGYLKDIVEIALRSELQLFADRIRELDSEEAAKVIDIVIPALNRIFALFHERRVESFLKELSLGRLAAATVTERRKPRAAATKQAPSAAAKAPKPRRKPAGVKAAPRASRNA
ncbi:MerR family transcriptional regulator [Nevskia soli]|uniref:MerR family transcriptional regulator n=1 Tax=Nevskia soli TaxID=418856 RepID=UPI0004A77B84|nr:MerR family transcriptional regulator [Nevskia soli]